MKHAFRLVLAALPLTAVGLGAAKADINSMLLITCEPGAPYFSIETLLVETDPDLGPSIGGNGLRTLRSMIDQPIQCMVGKHRVQATLTEFYPTNEHWGLESADIVVTVDGKVAADLLGTHHMDMIVDGRMRVEVGTYQIQTCESTTNDWALEREKPAAKDQRRRSLLCTRKFLSD